MTVGTNPSRIEVRMYQQSDYRSVIELFKAEYGDSYERLSARFQALYEHPFQLQRSVRLVATLDAELVGFQTLFYWPYEYRGHALRCVQSGNSLVSPVHRGRGIFGALLKEVDKILAASDLDAAIGFPVDASLGSFVRRGWFHLGDLDWYVRPVWSLSSLLGKPLPVNFGKGQRTDIAEPSRDDISLTYDPAFRDWRSNLPFDAPYRHIEYWFSDSAIAFELKFEKRSRLNWAVIGRIGTKGSVNGETFSAALRRLVSDLSTTRAVSMISVACNSQAGSGELFSALLECQFTKLRGKHIHFVMKPIRNEAPEILDFTRWSLYRSDVDTW